MPGALLLDDKTLFLVYIYVWRKDVAKISKVSRAPRNVNLAWAVTLQVGVTIYSTVFNNNLLPPPQFLQKKTFEKKSGRRNAHSTSY